MTDADDPATPSELLFDERWRGASIWEPDWHFHRRLLYRYGIVLQPGEYSRIVRHIRRGKAKFLENKGDDVALYEVWIRSANQRVVVLASSKRLLTAWPPRWQQTRRRR